MSDRTSTERVDPLAKLAGLLRRGLLGAEAHAAAAALWRACQSGQDALPDEARGEWGDWGQIVKYLPDPLVPGDPQARAEPNVEAEDVERVIAYSEGENEVEDWLALCALKDGRYAYVEAGCDYTGWG